MKNKILSGNKISVIGAGISGTGLAILAKKLGAQVLVSELKNTCMTDTENKLKHFGIDIEIGVHSKKVWESDMILLSSGIAPDSIAVREANIRSIPVIGELDFLFPYLEGTLIGITGSNGKTTTTSLVEHLIRKTGKKVTSAGNIGTALSDVAYDSQDYIVMELSSFQLHWAHNFSVDMAVLTNLASDHLDWHKNYQNYVNSKAKLLNNLRPNGWAVLQERDYPVLNIELGTSTALLNWGKSPSDDIRGRARAWIVLGERKIVIEYSGGRTKILAEFKDIPLIGKHNMENAAMALSTIDLLGMSVKKTSVTEMMGDFTPPPHRCQLVATVNGIHYIDDSKGTNVAASVAALSSIEGEKIVILGGKGKGEDYTPLAKEICNSARAAILLGEEREAIAEDLVKAGYKSFYIVSTMEEAVLRSTELATKGTSVILSPACTSWDMYDNYKERGKHFQKIIRTSVEENDRGHD